MTNYNVLTGVATVPNCGTLANNVWFGKIKLILEFKKINFLRKVH